MKNKLIILLISFFLLTSYKSQAESRFFNYHTKILNKLNIKKNSRTIQGLYLDSSFVSILGNIQKEDSLLLWSKKHQFNKFSYYHMGKILASDMIIPLASFIEKAKKQGIEDHTAIMGGDSTFTLIKKFNSSQSLNSKFTSIQIEDEWWQSDNTIADYNNVVDLLKKMKSWGTKQKPAVAVDLYFGRFNNIPDTQAEAADTLVKYTDRVLIAHQFDDPMNNFYPGYLKNRVRKFHNAAKKAKAKYPIIIIFYPGQAPVYYGKNSYQSAFSKFINRVWDNSVKRKDLVHGYQIFAYTEAFY